MLCQACEGIFRGDFLSGESQPHHNDITDIYKAALSECWVCEKHWHYLSQQYWGHYRASKDISREEKERLMIQDFSASRDSYVLPLEPGQIGSAHEDDLVADYRGSGSRYELHSSDKRIPILIYWLRSLAGDPARLSLDFLPHGCDTGRDNQAGFICDFARFTLKRHEDADDLTFNELTAHDDPSYSIQLAKHWLERCTRSHQKCSGSSSDWLPTRLLHLAAPCPTKVQLVTTNSGSVHGPYVTLSHCWGKADFLKLTAETSSDLFSGIEVIQLPQTFQDAIDTALKLNVNYLWIDSLCIFQDDPEDWLRESSMMGEVYQNGLCNIAATKSRDANVSFVAEKSPRIPFLRPPCYIQSAWNNAVNARWHIESVYRERRSQHLSGPLLSRGWVVQERIMAPRVLHFGSNQIYWECHEHDACEIYPHGVPLRGFKNRHKSLADCIHLTEIMALWANIIRMFSGCQLTFERDKLVALSGVAKAIKGRYKGCQYLAGLWKDDLETQLLWGTNTPSNCLPQSYRAPSWSWASIDGPVWLNDRDFYSPTPAIIILEAVTEPLGDDPMGQVKSGFIQLIGPLMTVSLCQKPAYDIYPRIRTYDRKINGAWVQSSSIDADADGESLANLHCLPVLSNKKFEDEGLFACLVLRPCGTRKGTFKRWGIMFVRFEECGVQIVDGIPQWSEIENEEWLNYEEDHGNGMYTITII